MALVSVVSTRVSKTACRSDHHTLNTGHSAELRAVVGRFFNFGRLYLGCWIGIAGGVRTLCKEGLEHEKRSDVGP